MPEPAARRVLILFAHPAYQRSRVNRALVESVHGLDGVTFHDLYEEYPTYRINARREQALLTEHDTVVWQHPFYWYSCPALLKEWLDLVLEYGWAYGEGGTALRGRKVLSAITTGGREEAYARGGNNRFSIRELLAPFEQTAALCGMEWLPPFAVHGTVGMEDDAAIAAHAADYRRVIEALRDGRLNASPGGRGASSAQRKPAGARSLSSHWAGREARMGVILPS